MRQYDLSIVYQDDHLTGKSVNASCSNCSIDEALSVLLTGKELYWTRQNNQIIISPNPILQRPYKITGYVKDKISGEFIAYANIHIPNSYLGSVSSENGFFIIPNVQSELCTLQVSYIGYETQTLLFDNNEENNSIIQINLSPKIISGKGITVMGEGYDMIQQGKQISQISYSPKNVANIPNLGENDVLRSLQLLPGIQAGNVGSVGLFIRGGTPDQNQILLDGITLYQMDHFFGFVSSINPEAIKDIQVYKSGFPVRFGERVNSIINLTGKNGDMNQTRFSLHTNQLSSGFSIQQPIFRSGSIILTYRSTFADQYHTDFYNKIYRFLIEGSGYGAIIQTDSTATESYTPTFDFSDINAKFTYLFSEKDIIYFSYYKSNDELLEKSKFNFGSDSFIIDIEDNTKWKNNGKSFKMSHQWENYSFTNFLISQSTYYSNYISNKSWVYESIPDRILFSDTLEFLEKNEINDLTIQFDHNIVFKNHNILLGIKNSSYQSSFDIVQDQDSIFYKDISRKTASLFGEDEFSITNRFILNTGLRATQYSDENNWSLLPRVALMYKLNPMSNMKLAVGKYIQYMHRFSNDFISSGNKFVWLLSSDRLKPITANHFVGGFYTTINNYVFNTEVYFNQKKNIASFSRLLFPGDTYDNGEVIQGNEYSKGIEVLIQKTKGKMTGWVSYHYAKSEWSFDDLNGGITFLSDHDRTHEFKFVTTTKIGPLRVTFSWLFLSGKVYTNKNDLVIYEDELGNISLEAKPGTFNNKRLPNIHRLDINLFKSFKKMGLEWQFGVSLFNVYNNRYISHKQYTFASTNQPIIVNDVKLIGFTPTLYFRLSR